MARLAAADAFRSLGRDRRQALWHILALDDHDAPLFAHLEPDEPRVELPPMALDETVVHDYDAIGLSLNAHPIALVREELEALGSAGASPVNRHEEEGTGNGDQGTGDVASAPRGRRRTEETSPQPNNRQSDIPNVAAEPGPKYSRPKQKNRRWGLKVSPNKVLKTARHGQRLAVAGLVLVRQRPGTASGIVFITLEDETGIANLIVRPRVWERSRRIARGKVALVAEGVVERQGEVVHLMVNKLHDLSAIIADVKPKSRDFH